MADFRETFDAGSEESFRVMFAGLQRHLHTTMIGIVSETSDGHNVSATPAVQQVIVDPTRTQTTYENFPLVMGMPAHFPGGGGTALTSPFVEGDEILMHAASRAFGFWRQSGGNQQPETERVHSLSDCIAQGGVRSDPRRLQQVASDAMHMRSDDKTVLHEMKPGVGVQAFHADPSTPPASPTFDPLSQASKFLSHVVQAARGVVGRAVDGSTEHSHGVDHGIGAWMKAMGAAGLVQALAHPDLGGLLSAADGKHSVTASPGGVMLQSTTSIGLDCPPGGLSLPSQSVGSSSLGTGAASENVGPLGGDLSGTLPSPQVVGIGNVNASTLPTATSDASAAAAGVPVGGLYRDTSIASGKSVLVVRMS